jgi:photosystem II stability/assembly factor-like uncharacterized protein
MKKKLCLTLFACIFLLNSVYSQWEQTDGPYGGVIEDILTNNTNFFVACSGNTGGVYTSSDNGIHWIKISQDIYGNSLTYARGLALKSNSLYVASTGVFKISIVNGIWQQSTIGLNGKFVEAVAAKDNDLYATVWNEGIYKSSDDGISWNAVNSGMLTKQVRTINTSGTDIYVGTTNGVFLSKDNGDSWIELDNALKEVDVKIITAQGTNLYFGSIGKGVYHYTTDGSFVERLNGGFDDTFPDICGLATNNEDIFSCTWSGHVYKLNNQNRLWQRFDNKLDCRHLLSMSIYNDTIFAGSGGFGLYSTSVTANDWQSTSTGIRAFKIISLASSDSLLFAATDNSGLFLSKDDGNSWKKSFKGITVEDANDLKILNNNIFLGTGGGMFVSTDRGDNWHLSNNGLDQQVNRIFINKNRVFAVSFGNGLYISSDSGNIWREANNIDLPSKLIYNVVVSDSNVFLTTFDAGVVLSEDLGETWHQITNGLTSKDVLLIILKDNFVFINVEGGDGIYRSDDMGKTWIAKNKGLENAYLTSLVVSNNMIFASTPNGIYASKNNGDSWEDIGNLISGYTKSEKSIENSVTGIKTMTVKDSCIFAGSENGILWKMVIPNIVLTDIILYPLDIDESYIRSYPNPISNLARIEYRTNRKERIKIYLIDISGRNIGLLLDKVKEPGLYYIDFERNRLPGGIYFLEMITDHGIHTQKMLIQ